MREIDLSLYPEPARLLGGRRALVTGGDSGIGRATVLELASHGAAVAINHVGDASEAGSIAAAVEKAGGRAIPVRMDVSQEADVQRGFAEAAEALGGLDLLVNNAGIQEPYELAEMPLEAWRRVIDVNLTGAFLCCREAARLMDRGTIVVNTSVHELTPWMRYSHVARADPSRALGGACRDRARLRGSLSCPSALQGHLSRTAATKGALPTQQVVFRVAVTHTEKRQGGPD